MTSMAYDRIVLAPIGLTPLLAQAATTALIMGGSGQGDPTGFTDYIPHVASYYIAPNSTCQPDSCRLVPVSTPGGVIPPFIATSATTSRWPRACWICAPMEVSWPVIPVSRWSSSATQSAES